MGRSVVGKVMWVGRATVFLVGLAVALALVLGVATAALGAPPASTFKLGQINASNAISTLVGAVAGPNLKIQNTGTGANATALELQVPQNQAPLTVNADAGKATNLDVDKLDGKDSSAYLPGDLPSGATVRGVYMASGYATAANEVASDAVSYGYRPSSRLTYHYISARQPTPEGCSGDLGNPGAAPGHACFFEWSSSNVTPRDASTNIFPIGQVGAVVFAESSSSGRYYIYGAWAVTAP